MAAPCLLLSLLAAGWPAPASWGQEATTVSTQPTQPPAAPQVTTAPADEPAARPIDPPLGLKSRTATGDWFGLRPALKDIGIETQFFYNNHFMSVWDGGRSTGGEKNSATIDWLTTFDLEKMKLLNDADVLIHVRDGWGYSINSYTGTTRALDVNDDADGKQDLYIDQFWFRQFFLDHKVALQLGYLDFQTIVDRNAYANIEDRQFMNTALDNNPTFPTAGATSLGAALYVQPVDWYTLILGTVDAQQPGHGAPDPYYKPGFSTTFHDEAWFTSYVENDFVLKIPTARGPLVGNYRFGMVYDPRVRPIFVRRWERPDQRGQDYGWYLSFDQQVFRENDRDAQGLGWFFRYGWRHEDINQFDGFWSTGLSYTGLVPERDADTLGFGIAQLRTSDDFQAVRNASAGSETVYELYYAIQVTPWLVVTPDIQYVDNPGANDTLPHVIVAGVRVRMTF
jgi:porin